MTAKAKTGILIAVLVGCLLCAIAFVLIEGKSASWMTYYTFSAVFALFVAVILYTLFKKSSEASADGKIPLFSFKTAGPPAVFVIAFGLMVYCRPPKDTKPFQFVVFQDNGLYKHHVDLTYQLPGADNQTIAIEGGGRTIAAVPGDTDHVDLIELSAAEKSYTPDGKTGSGPWRYDLDSNNTVRIALPPKPKLTTCKPPSRTELKTKLIAWLGSDSRWKSVEQIESFVKEAKSDEQRKAMRKKAQAHIVNETRRPIVLVGMDCKRLLDAPNEMSLMPNDTDWDDLVEFQGLDDQEAKDIYFKDYDGSTGVYCVFACVPVPEGRRAVYLGVFDFFQHDFNPYELIPVGGNVKLISQSSEKAR
jgi:hypothetical protein